MILNKHWSLILQITTWWQPQTSGYSYPRVTVIWIDVHPAGENLTNTPRTISTPVHVRLTYASCGQSLYMATFHTNPTELDRFTAPEKKWSRLRLPARLSGPWDPPQFLSQHNHWSSALKPNICRQQATRFTGPISPACDRTFNTCSRVPNPRSLTDTDGGYHIENLKIATTLSPPFPSKGSTDPPNGPTQSQIVPTKITNWTGVENKP
jgi:hypothetical protein